MSGSAREKVPLKKNQIIPLAIDALSHQGQGIGRYEGMAVFVPHTAIGDEIQAQVVKVEQRMAFAISQELVALSPHRIDEDCPVFRRCGGCSLRHIDYVHELEIKEGWVRENLRRIGGLEPPVDPILPSPRTGRYRNKAQYPVALVDGKVTAGFFAPRSHRLVEIGDCALQPDFFGSLAEEICRFAQEKGIPPYDEKTHTGLLRHIYLRHGEATGQVMVCLVVNGTKFPGWQELLERLRGIRPGIVSFLLNRNTRRTNVILGDRDILLWGKDCITDRLCGLEVRISARSFYQVNRPAAEALYRQALEYADPSESDILLDLYCGAGTIGLSMAHRVGEVIGVEVVEQAKRDAEENARQNGIGNARFLCGDAAAAAAQLEREGLRPDILVVDPPRKGITPEVIASAAAMMPAKLVYISCNSATLARDCRLLAEAGYRLARVRAVDLFPRTAHVEAVALMERTV